MKSVKSLLIPAAILLVLIVVAVVYLVIPKKDDEHSGEVSNESVSVLSISNSEIERFSMHKKNGDDLEFTSVVDSQTGEQEWTLVGNDNEISQYAVSSYVSILSSYVTTGIISAPDDLSEYSLDDPDFTVDITKFDGTSAKIIFGSYTFDNAGVYFMVDGDPNVYITAKLKRDYCDYKLIDFASTGILSIDFADVESVEFIRDNDDVDIVASPVAEDGSFEHPSFMVTSPVECPANNNFENIVDFIGSLQISGYEEISDSDLAGYGLDDPTYEFIFSMNDGSEITVSLSAKMNGRYYGYCSEVEGYFSINELSFSGIDTPLMSLLDSYICGYEANEVSSITGTYGDASFVFELSIHNSMSETGAAATLNSRNAYVRIVEGGRSYASILFDSIAGMQYSGVDADADPELDPALSYRIVTNDYQIVDIDFVARDDGSYYVFRDGEYTGFYVVPSVLFAYGGNDPYGYGSWAAYELTVEAIDNSINGIYELPGSFDDSTGAAA